VDLAALAAELDKPLAGQLLRGSPLTRLAYTALDGTPRVIPIGYLWKDRRVLVCTIPTSAKVKALRQNPAVALTIDSDGQPPRCLLLRGRASIEVVDGVPQDYIDASLKNPKRARRRRLRRRCSSDLRLHGPHHDRADMGPPERLRDDTAERSRAAPRPQALIACTRSGIPLLWPVGSVTRGPVAGR